MNTWSCITTKFLLPHISHLPSVIRRYIGSLTYSKIFQSMTIHFYCYSTLFSVVIVNSINLNYYIKKTIKGGRSDKKGRNQIGSFFQMGPKGTWVGRWVKKAEKRGTSLMEIPQYVCSHRC